ncbi:16S rRNA (cytosine(1402)-N(4))-methyltransferase RsmH [Chitinimonas sp. BJB300]|uniref:16S rRNA (cytosine(1402)-N(4))-methyltransferase RsmH n=1 Tax=Chitinimonas sp. BJB300 TaxID=1559339 RepID=UPI000C0FE1C3|nr:16S rRNA (cytosine(1402)-N(4))-methyltransferase RsmH [Chitinimonas sp. BJB300]PHV12766.1 16S rRNA (cytosine(1402)-N(4))-methyltransferase [Chitinimonas sp. BJB300]TSJ91364.1 16S rRNA (cytosine(1402)-N(4))-methyltransferase RsmH [Chitinimonas sp. BJB300]
MSAAVFTHRTVLLTEAVVGLNVQPDGVYVDCTYGRGGHSRLILSQLGPKGRLIAFDRDPAAVANAKTIDDPRFHIVHEGFSRLDSALDALGIDKVDGVLMDLGVSSPQIDEAARGFSFRFDAPLDMRMDTTRGQTAAEWLATAEQADIAEVIRDYGEERFAKQVASAIVTARALEPIDTTGQLAKIVATAVRTREPGQDPATRTFQAVRIYINRELEELSLTLPQAFQRLCTGGRLSVIAFHSLEDRIVKRFMVDAATADKLPSRLPVRAADIGEAPLKLVGKAARASKAEIDENPRARSAILRVAERSHAPIPVQK